MSKKEYLIEKGLFSITLLMVLIICLVVTFVVIEAIPAFDYYGVFNFIFNTNWAPDNNQFGIFPMIVGSIVITAIALIIAVPLSLFCAIFLEEIASVRLKNYFMPIIQTLAGIPSVIYGFWFDINSSNYPKRLWRKRIFNSNSIDSVGFDDNSNNNLTISGRNKVRSKLL